ncbi:MAG: hypothetical protein HY744_32820 [Deltaproteobacteria bacterium]|nr:hypothetical protein [Deltaproteobacteria bacterium]
MSRKRRGAARDEYEERYMAGGKALARSRMRMPGWFHLLMLASVAIVAGAATTTTLASAAQAPAFLLVPLVALIWLVFSHVRVTVGAEHVHVQFGLFGPKVPMRDIVSAEVERYDWVKYGGWGIKRSLADGSWAYSVPGGDGSGLRLVYRDRRGKTRRLFVSADNATQLVAAIDRARAAASGATQARIADDDEEARELREAEQEIEAELEGKGRGGKS